MRGKLFNTERLDAVLRLTQLVPESIEMSCDLVEEEAFGRDRGADVATS